MKQVRKISYLPNPNKGTLPYIRLSGNWLMSFGFYVGMNFKLTTEQNKIIIETIKQSEDNK